MKYLILLVLILELDSFAQPVWEKLNGPLGGESSGILASGDTVIAGLGFDGIIYYSTNGGIQWNFAIKIYSPVQDFIKMGDGTVFAAGYNNGIYKSYDLNNWVNVFNTGEEFWSLGKDKDEVIYAGTDNGKIYNSLDNGNEWHLILNNAGGRINNFIVTEDSIVFAGGFSKILKKGNSYYNWEEITLDSLTGLIKIFMDNNNNIYAYSNARIFASNDLGQNWQERDSSRFIISGEYLYRCVYNNRIIGGFGDETQWFGDGWGAAISDDNGQTWQWSTIGLPPKISSINNLAVSQSNTYAGTNAAGIFKSNDFGDTWFPVNNGIYAAITEDITFDKDSNLYTANWSNGIQKSTDRGNSWEIINNGLTNSYLYSIVADTNNNLMAGTDQGIFRSTNHGENWVQTADAGNNFAYYLYKDRANRIYALTYGTGLYRTTDLGYSWTGLNNAFVSPYLFAFAEDSSNNLYVGTRGGWIYKSTNDGAVWISVYHSNISNTAINGISVSPNGSIFATNIYEGVLRSTNQGQSWALVKPDPSWQFRFPINVNKEGEIFTTGSGDKFFRSTNNGQSWEDITGNLQLVSIKRILFDRDDKIYLATDESVWRGDRVIPVEFLSFTAAADNEKIILNWETATETNNRGFEVQRSEVRGQRSEVKGQRSEVSEWEKIGFVEGSGTTTETKNYSFTDKNISVGTYSYRLKQIDFDGSFKYSKEIEVEINTKLEFSLEQNYPNPFNPTTTIDYSIKYDGFVSLKVYNILGQLVAYLVNQEQKSGFHTIDFDASNLPSGIYIYTLKTSGFTSVRKMLLIR